MSIRVPNLFVLMPVYRCQPFLAQAIHSVLAQTCRDYEFIVVDDRSSDSSGDVIARLGRREPRTAEETQRGWAWRALDCGNRPTARRIARKLIRADRRDPENVKLWTAAFSDRWWFGAAHGLYKLVRGSRAAS